VVATDLVMPGKEGTEMILELAGKLGAGQILAKPFTGQEILAAINQVLGS
jgi:FixJ family two-component response regulator